MRRGGTVPHTAIIYKDKAGRKRLLGSAIERHEDASWGSVAVLSCDPRSDAAQFKGKEWSKGGRSHRTPVLIVDVPRLLEGCRDTAEDVGSVISRIASGATGGVQPLIVGDWLHLVYERFGVGLSIEEDQTRKNRRNMICCYKSEGFWSLDLAHISRVFELHDDVLFGEYALRPRGLPAQGPGLFAR